jgi:CheY-like chemotaxis protein
MMSGVKPILVVEDDPDVLELYVALLQVKGYEVVTSRNGVEALEVLRRVTPALVLLDLMMPVMNGWEFLRVIGQDPAIAHLPIVVLSAVADQKPPGAVKALLKPVDVQKLWDLVAQYC